MNNPSPTSRYTLRDLPLPAKLVVTAFLISVGLGYLWAMAQIHFKHASLGNPMPTTEDLVSRFSGVPWPIEPKPIPNEEEAAKQADRANAVGVQVPAVKIKTIVDTRCTWCHGPDGEKSEMPLTKYDEIAKYLMKNPENPKGHLHTVLTGSPKNWNRKSMVKAFKEKSQDWDDMTSDQRTAAGPKREAERLAMIAWVEAGAPQAQYEANAFPLPSEFQLKDLPEALNATAPPLAPATEAAEPKAADKWKEAKKRQISVEALTQSTHAHLLSFSMLWALTGLAFAFTSYSYRVRCILSPLVLVVQVVDIACWWLARLDGSGPYFAIAIVATGGIVALGLGGQITLSLFNMYEKKGKMILAMLFLIGAGLFGLTYVKVIAPQLQAEKDFVAQRAK